MGEVIPFKKKSKHGGWVEVSMLAGVVVEKPRTQSEYLRLCKEFLGPDDYNQILKAIMDLDYLKQMTTEEPHLVAIVEAYYSFKV